MLSIRCLSRRVVFQKFLNLALLWIVCVALGLPVKSMAHLDATPTFRLHGHIEPVPAVGELSLEVYEAVWIGDTSPPPAIHGMPGWPPWMSSIFLVATCGDRGAKPLARPFWPRCPSRTAGPFCLLATA